MGFDYETDVLFLMQSWAWSTTTTSSSSSLAMGEPPEPVRDAVSSQLDLCSQSDTVELIRLLLDRQRALRRQDQQIGLALEEAMARIAVRPHELPYNAMTVMRTIWPVIARESLSGLSSASSSSIPHGSPTQYPRLVLRPWLPRDLGELHAAFPEQDPALIAGYRRRMWRSHVQRLYRDIGRDCPAGNWGHADDSTLFLVQADGNVPVPNHPSDVPPPERTFVERRLLGTASRRRGCRHRAHRGHAAVPARMAGDETEDTGGLEVLEALQHERDHAHGAGQVLARTLSSEIARSVADQAIGEVRAEIIANIAAEAKLLREEFARSRSDEAYRQTLRIHGAEERISALERRNVGTTAASLSEETLAAIEDTLHEWRKEMLG
eukprot:s2184_g5.t1